jgi:hypothetical protein
MEIPMLRGKNRLSHDIDMLLFEGPLRKVLWVFLCNCINILAAFLVFRVGNSVVGFGNEKVKKKKK